MRRQVTAKPPFRTMRATRSRGENVVLHAHDEAQLLFAAVGTMQVYTATGRWLVPPQLAVWIPSSVPHRIDVLSGAEVWMIYWDRQAWRRWAPAEALYRAFALRVTPLLRELIFAAFGPDASSEHTELVVRLILHQLTATPDAPTFLPLPASKIGLRIADLALSDRRSVLDIDELGSRAATSARTVSRLFPAETGLTFKSWRQRARIVVAIDQLVEGRAISGVAAASGFASTAAFSHAFRQVTGLTPTAFIEGGRRTH